jgi:NADP-dependent 3-hydroxy acid dehydrogenase YdfG
MPQFSTIGLISRRDNRDIVDTILFALERPRHVTLASIIIDPDTGGLN